MHNQTVIMPEFFMIGKGTKTLMIARIIMILY